MPNTYLTVAELIEELKKMPKGALVMAKYAHFYFSKVKNMDDSGAVELS